MPNRLTRIRHAWQIYVAVGVATAPMIAVALTQGIGRPAKVALYAGVGDELTAFTVDVEHATLTRQASLALPGFVQEAWASPSTPYVYVAWSNGGASYAGSGVAGAGDRHGITAFRIESATGRLHAEGTPAPLRSRPIHITGDSAGQHLLVAYNDPSGVSVHPINSDGTIGREIPQASTLDVGIYAHQVRMMPTNKSVILVTRGNQATSTTREDPGALKIFRFERGVLANRASIAPSHGLGFRSRHLDFHPTKPWVFLTLESQNRLEVFRITGDTLGAEALFSESTLAHGGGELPGQSASTVHVHPSGQYVYVGNRNGSATSNGGSNDIAVFRVNPQSGRPSLIQNADTHGITPRTFSIDRSGRLLAVGNQTTANLALFRIAADGRLEFMRAYDLAVGRKPLWWMGLVQLQ